MAVYIVNKNAQTNGDHEVHVITCERLPLKENRHHLGNFESCKEALVIAKGYNSEADGCAYCCHECHES